MSTPAKATLYLARELAPVSLGRDREAFLELAPGARVLTSEWDSLFVDARLRTRVAAVSRRVDRAGAFCRAAALAQHGIPVFGAPDDRVDLVAHAGRTRHNARDVRRHHEPLPAGDVQEVGGVRVTTLERTLYDVMRTARLETAVVAGDAVLRHLAWDPATNQYDAVAADAFRDRIGARLAASPGARGVRQARFVAEFADGRAQLPGESLTRLRFWQFRLPDPELQRRVELGGGRYALLDLALPRRRRWVEFDGEAKYSDATMLAGRSADQVVAAQLRRQRAVERATGWRCDRIGWSHVLTVDAFERWHREIDLFP